ncbi:hypothetical protein FOG51_02402 [Hanseniaspora uvarum]|nr:hypothetical protein FOG51_02402 [Hanseniaspora uvarum]
MSIDFVKDILEELKNLKKGVSAKRINKLTDYTLKNIELEDEVTDLIIDYSKNASASHKVGSLYLIDSLGRAALTNCNDLGLNILENDTKVGTLQHIIKKFSGNIKTLLSECYEKLDNDEEVEKINQLKEVWISEGLFNENLLNDGDSDTDEIDTTPKEDESKSEAVESSAPEFSSVDDTVDFKETEKKNEPLPRHVYVKTKNGSKIPFINESLSNIEKKEEQLRALKEVLFFMNDNPMDLIVTKNLNEDNMPTSYDYADSKQSNHQEKKYNNWEGNNNNNFGKNNNNNFDNFGKNNVNKDQMTLIVGEKNEAGSIHFRNKPVLDDATCPLNNVRVMSRTLFIGGISNRDTKRDLINKLKPYGEIQTCFLNGKKGHGFVKAYSRAEAENIIKTFNILSSQDPHELRVRWALGFGPRAYFNFDTGISTIPLYVITDSEKEWARNSEWGGTNGKDMNSGILFEEPDYNPNEVTKINNRRLDFQDHANISNKPLSQRQATELARTNPEILNQRYAQQQQFLYGQQQQQQQQFQGMPQGQQQMFYQNNNSNMYNQQGGNNGMYSQQQGNNNGMYNQQQNSQNGMYNQQQNNSGMYSQQPSSSQQSNNGMYNHQPSSSQQSNSGMYNQQPSANQLNNLMNILNQHPQ